MTAGEIARMAVLENQVTALVDDVGEIKKDVKGLIQAQTQLALALAVKEARDKRTEEAGASIGTWVRFALPWIISVISLVVLTANVIRQIVTGS